MEKEIVLLIFIALISIFLLFIFLKDINGSNEMLRLCESMYAIEYPNKLEILKENYNTFLIKRNLIPFIKGKKKFRMDYIGREFSLNEFNIIIEKDIRSSKVAKKEINIGMEKSYKIEIIASSKEHLVNVYAYNEGVILKITLFTSKKDYEKDNLLLNEILSSLQFTDKPYGYLSRKFIKEWKKYSMGNIEVYYRPNGYVDTNINIEEWTKKRVKAFLIWNLCQGQIKKEWLSSQMYKMVPVFYRSHLF